MLVQLLGAQAWVVESTVDVAEPVRAGEQDAVEGAVPGRVAEFVTGRWCARQALAAADIPGVDLPADRSGAPRWPVGTVGSITHCEGYRAAAVARSQCWAAIGVDAEPARVLPDGVWEMITSVGERRHVSALGRGCDGPLDRVVFSAKESIYKTWSARTRRGLDFTDAELRLAADGTFTARLRLVDVRYPPHRHRPVGLHGPPGGDRRPHPGNRRPIDTTERRIMTDFYATNADIYAAISLPSLPGQLAALRSVVNEPLPGAVVEVAAGVGTALTTLAEMTSEALYAVEPSTSMQVGLMTTVAGDETLRKRVTILPGTLRQVSDRLPERLGGIVVLNALGHFEPEELEDFWPFAARSLVPGGQLVLGLQPPFEPGEIPWTDFGECRIGNLTYRTSGTASVTSDDLAKWTMRWTIHDANGSEVERREASTQWAIVGPQKVTDAAIAVGLEASGQHLDGNTFSFRQPR